MTRNRQSAFQLTGDKHSDNRFLAMRIMALLGLAARTMRRRLLASSTAREADQSAQRKGRRESKGYNVWLLIFGLLLSIPLLVDPTQTIESLAIREGKSERSIRMT